MTRIADLERRGRVDAVIRLVLSRRFAQTMTAEDWCDVLDVTPREVRAELERRRGGQAKARQLVPRREMPTDCPGCGKTYPTKRGAATCARTHQPPVACPVCGRECNPVGLGVHVAKAHGGWPA